MEKFYDFSRLKDAEPEFDRVYSPNCSTFGTFRQEKDCIVNCYNREIVPQTDPAQAADYPPARPDYYAYMSLLSRETYPVGTEAVTHCSFESYGAPLIVFADRWEPDKNGRPMYIEHHEVVAYHGGINVWNIVPCPEDRKRPILPTLLGKMNRDVADNHIMELGVRFLPGAIEISLDGESARVEVPHLPERFHIGITACEGINRFYDLIIRTPD